MKVRIANITRYNDGVVMRMKLLTPVHLTSGLVTGFGKADADRDRTGGITLQRLETNLTNLEYIVNLMIIK